MSNTKHFYGVSAGKGGIDTAAAEKDPNARIWEMSAKGERQKIAAKLGEEYADQLWRIEDASWQAAYERMAGLFAAIDETVPIVGRQEIDLEWLGTNFGIEGGEVIEFGSKQWYAGIEPIEF